MKTEKNHGMSHAAAAAVRNKILLLGSAGGLVFRGAGLSTAGGYGNGAKRQLFSSFQDELTIEEDYFDDPLLPEKKRRLTPEQVHHLEKSFEAENKLEPEKKTELAKKLGLQPRQVAVWYQNRRARWKTKQLERDFGRLKALYDALVSDHDSLLADNERLRSEVLCLTEQLRAQSTPQIPATHRHLPPDQEALQASDEISPPAPEMKQEGHLGFALNTKPEWDISFHCRDPFAIASDEDDFSDDGGGYFLPMPPDDDDLTEPLHLRNDNSDDPSLKFEDDGGGFTAWSVWS